MYHIYNKIIKYKKYNNFYYHVNLKTNNIYNKNLKDLKY